MEQWFELKGTLVYDPVRPDFKKSHKTRTLIIELPRDTLDLYYQWFLRRQHGTWLDLQRPMYGTHVTIVKGNEHVPDLTNWKKHAGKTVTFQVSPLVRRHWHFWNLPVRGPRLDELRSELGLTKTMPFHLTIGRQYDWQPT